MLEPHKTTSLGFRNPEERIAKGFKAIRRQDEVSSGSRQELVGSEHAAEPEEEKASETCPAPEKTDSEHGSEERGGNHDARSAWLGFRPSAVDLPSGAEHGSPFGPPTANEVDSVSQPMPGGPCGVQPKTEASQGVSQEEATAGKSDALRPESAEAPGVESAEGTFAALLVSRAEGGLSVGQSQPVARSSMRTAQLQKPPAPSRPIHALQECRSDLIPRQTERETHPGRQGEEPREQDVRGEPGVHAQHELES